MSADEPKDEDFVSEDSVSEDGDTDDGWEIITKIYFASFVSDIVIILTEKIMWIVLCFYLCDRWAHDVYIYIFWEKTRKKSNKIKLLGLVKKKGFIIWVQFIFLTFILMPI